MHIEVEERRWDVGWRSASVATATLAGSEILERLISSAEVGRALGHRCAGLGDARLVRVWAVLASGPLAGH